MYCKNHETSVASLQCSVCGEHFCDLCNNSSNPFVCTSCSEKISDNSDIETLVHDNEFNVENVTSDITEKEIIDTNFDNFNGNLADDILNDILNSVTIPEKTKINFDPSDILGQIEAGLEAELSNTSNVDYANNNADEIPPIPIVEATLDYEQANESFISENVSENDLSEETQKVELTKELDSNSTVENIEKLEFSNTDDIVLESTVESTVENTVENTVESTVNTKEKTSKVDYFKSKFTATKDVTVEKINNIDMTSTKEKASKLSVDTKEKASKLSDEAKIKSAAAAAFTAETAKKAKIKANQTIATNKSNFDETITKIQDANTNGEYDELLSKFNTHYGQGAKETDVNTQFALPLKINNFLYFLCSLIPGIAQLYLGLTKRGTTILLIASVFLFVTMTPSLFFITSILSFADAYKLRNIYYRGGLIEDSNRDIASFMKNKYVILAIIATIILNIIRSVF